MVDVIIVETNFSNKGEIMKKITAIVVLALFVSSGLNAQSIKTPKLNAKQKTQLTKIKKGVKSGELTKKETKNLLKQEQKLQKHKKIAKSDGVVTKKERARLNAEARKLDVKIYKQKHGRQKRK
jgi:hypothetical protein